MMARALGGLLAAAATIAFAGPAAALCESARANASVASQPEPWRRAVEELVRSASIPDRPWSCNPATIEVFAHETGATLSIVDADGHFFTREITSADELVPLGEALLSRPVNPPAPSPPAPVIAPTAPAPSTPARDVVTRPAAPTDDTPRALVSAMISPRYAGNSKILWGGVNATVLIPFGSWSAGLWGRFDGPEKSLGAGNTSINEASIGAAAGYTFHIDKLELRPSFVPSVAIVTRNLGPHVEEETHVVGRLGADVRAILPISSLFRAVLGVDAELSPRELDSEDRPEHDGVHVTPMPTYTLGVGLGMELALR